MRCWLDKTVSVHNNPVSRWASILFAATGGSGREGVQFSCPLSLMLCARRASASVATGGECEEGRSCCPRQISPRKPSDDVHVLGYTMQKHGSEWQAIDVVIDGLISFAAVKEAELRAILWSNGASAQLIRFQQLAEALSDAGRLVRGFS